jgi:hypothetical protein
MAGQADNTERRQDRLKQWEPLRDKNKLARFCLSGFPIGYNALHWDPRVAGFPAIHVTNLRNLRPKAFSFKSVPAP